MPAHRKSPIEIIEDPATHCWVWQLSDNGVGYGILSRNGRKRLAHRLYYQDLIGPIPEDRCLDHLCRNRACVNPGHLEPVTMRENLLRGVGVSAKNAIKTHCPRGHELAGVNLYVHPATGHRSCKRCRADSSARFRARQSVATVQQLQEYAA